MTYNEAIMFIIAVPIGMLITWMYRKITTYPVNIQVKNNRTKRTYYFRGEVSRMRDESVELGDSFTITEIKIV